MGMYRKFRDGAVKLNELVNMSMLEEAIVDLPQELLSKEFGI